MKKGLVFSIAAMMILFMLPVSVEAKTKTVKRTMTIDLNRDGKTCYFAPTVMKKNSRLKVKTSNKKVVVAKYVNHKEIGKNVKLQAKKGGKVKVTVFLYEKKKLKKKYIYSIKVIGKGQDGYKSMSKKAFQIQNDYRNAKGKNDLEWSDELYQFALYRLKNHGFDSHKYLDSDTNDYFKNFVTKYRLSLGENQASGQTTAKYVMISWKNSKGHYHNLLSSDYKCGAIARYKDDWCAIFSMEDASLFEKKNEVNETTKEIVVKRYDSATQKYVIGSSILYYDVDDRWGTTKSQSIGKESGLKICLEIGKTYVISEKTPPNGLEKVEKITITVTEDSPTTIILGK